MNLILGTFCTLYIFSLTPDHTEADEVGRGQEKEPRRRAASPNEFTLFWTPVKISPVGEAHDTVREPV